MKKIMMTIMAAVAVCTAFGQSMGKGPKPRRGADTGIQMTDAIVRFVQNPDMTEKLGISAEQNAKLAEVCNIEKETMAETQKKLRSAMENQKKLLKNSPVEESAVMKSVDEVFELRKTMAKIQMKKVIAVRSILTAEQLGKASEIMKVTHPRKGNGNPSRGKGRKARLNGGDDKAVEERSDD